MPTLAAPARRSSSLLPLAALLVVLACLVDACGAHASAELPSTGNGPRPVVTPFADPPDSAFVDVVYAHSSPARVFARTFDGDVYNSTDGGATWRRDARLADVDAIYVSPLRGELVYYVTRRNEVFWTHDGGKTLRRKTSALLSIAFHPSEPLWALELRFHTTCSFGSAAALDDACFTELWLTQDGGDTSRRIATYVRTAEWASEHHAFADTPTAILASVFTNKTGGYFYRRAFDSMALVRTDDFFASATQLVHGVQSFVVSRTYIAAAVEGARGTGLVPYVNGRFVCSHLPSDLAQSAGDQVTVFLHRSLSSVLIGHDAGESDGGGGGGGGGRGGGGPPAQAYGTLLRSDADGVNFHTVLRRVVRPRAHTYEVALLSAFTLVANRADAPGRVVSMLSSDLGASWTTAPPPLTYTGDDRERARTLFNIVRGSSPAGDMPHDSAATPALAVANGRVVVDDADGVRVERQHGVRPLLSRDFGITWRDALNGGGGGASAGDHPMRFAVSAHGVVLAMLERASSSSGGGGGAGNADDALLYSYDEGDTRVAAPLGDGSVHLRQPVLAAPPGRSGAGFSLLVYDSLAVPGALYHVSFAALASRRNCSGAATPNTEASDYETAALARGDCVFGARRHTVRRRPTAVCVVRDDVADAWAADACPCGDVRFADTDEANADGDGDGAAARVNHNYECELGFKLSRGQCEPAFALPPDGACAPGAAPTYTVPSVRVVDGNRCTDPPPLPTRDVSCALATGGNGGSGGDCDCSGHGSCATSADACLEHCECEQGYVGRRCQTPLSATCDATSKGIVCPHGPCIATDHCYDCRGAPSHALAMCEGFDITARGGASPSADGPDAVGTLDSGVATGLIALAIVLAIGIAFAIAAFAFVMYRRRQVVTA